MIFFKFLLVSRKLTSVFCFQLRTQWQCCGFNSYASWSNSLYSKSSVPKGIWPPNIFIVPKSCCIDTFSDACEEMHLSGVHSLVLDVPHTLHLEVQIILIWKINNQLKRFRLGMWAKGYVRNRFFCRLFFWIWCSYSSIPSHCNHFWRSFTLSIYQKWSICSFKVNNSVLFNLKAR